MGEYRCYSCSGIFWGVPARQIPHPRIPGAAYRICPDCVQKKESLIMDKPRLNVALDTLLTASSEDLEELREDIEGQLNRLKTILEILNKVNPGAGTKPSRITPEVKAEILRRYGPGQEVREIAADLQLNPRAVNLCINRSKARRQGVA